VIIYSFILQLYFREDLKWLTDRTTVHLEEIKQREVKAESGKTRSDQLMPLK
jgi:hypothetical protein